MKCVIRKWKLLALQGGMAIAVALMVAFAPTVSHAQAAAQTTCTSFVQRATTVYDKNTLPATKGLLTEIYEFIKQTVGKATQNLYDAFIQSAGYKQMVGAAITLMVLFYGIGFTIGIVQPSFQQVLMRLIKIGIITALVSPSGGWAFFNDHVVTFFQDGTDDIIRGVQIVGMGIPQGNIPPGASPFFALDRMAEFLIQPDTLVAILGSAFNGGPFGFTMAALTGLVVYGFVDLVIKALQVYAVTFVARSLMLGVAPIFFVFLLFEKTKGMFVAWLNTLLNLSLKPILLFTFLAFFLSMMENASRDMFGTELCWDEITSITGAASKVSFWHFQGYTDADWNGSLECIIQNNPNAPNAKKCPDFPINIVDLLSFLLLVYLARRFSDVVDKISNELSNAYVGLDSQARFNLDSANQKAGQMMGNTTSKQGGQRSKGKKGK